MQQTEHDNKSEIREKKREKTPIRCAEAPNALSPIHCSESRAAFGYNKLNQTRLRPDDSTIRIGPLKREGSNDVWQFERSSSSAKLKVFRQEADYYRLQNAGNPQNLSTNSV